MKRLYRKLKHFISQSVAYSVFIWKNDNYDWDYAYFLRLIRFKLDRMAKTIQDNDITDSSKRVTKQIRYAVFLLDEYHNENFQTKLEEDHRAKWGSIIIHHEPTDKGYARLRTSYTAVTSPEEQAQADKESLQNYVRGAEYNKQLLDRLFRHMNKYIQTWWD